MAASFHLSVTLSYVSRLRDVWEPYTAGCLPMCCSLFHCMAACNCEDVSCPEGFTARSPGSWQGGSWVSALLGGLFCWTPSQDLAPWSGVVCFCSVQDIVQGRPPLRLQNSYQFKVQKTNPKTSLLDLLVLIMTTCPFLLC